MQRNKQKTSSNKMIHFPKGLAKQQFLDEYWQKKPLLFNKAMENSAQLISEQSLFDLSLDDEVESRLLIEDGPDEPWQLYHGPQDKNQLDDLKECSNWTLLVQSVNLWHSGCAKLLADFAFIPQWRLDDIMISYSTQGGSVGPHVDHYDVFLIQLSGTRRWCVGEPDAKVELLDSDSSSQHIKPYPITMDEQLSPGDMLYLPPNTAHHGITIEPGMTLSVGFRSPALSEMMMIFAEQMIIDNKESYYQDPPFVDGSSSTEISAAAMTKAVNWFSNLTDYDSLQRKAFGILQTQPKQGLILDPVELDITELVQSNIILERDPCARVAWYQANETEIWLFVNGEHFNRPESEKDLINFFSTAPRLTSKQLTSKQLSSGLSDNKFLILLEIFVETGFFGLK